MNGHNEIQTLQSAMGFLITKNYGDCVGFLTQIDSQKSIDGGKMLPLQAVALSEKAVGQKAWQLATGNLLRRLRSTSELKL